VSLIENDSDIYIDGVIDQMPPHSFEVFVNALNDASTNNAIGQAIYDSKSLGIEVVSTDQGGRVGNVIDVNGEEITVPFSSTVDIVITIQVTITVDSDYPSDGDDQIKRNLVDFFNRFEIAEDVLNHNLFTPVNEVPGILTLSILTSQPGGGGLIPGNQDIDTFETATTSTGFITIVV
jgi:hypothetical protein